MRSSWLAVGALFVGLGFAACANFGADPNDGVRGGDADVADDVLDIGSTDARANTNDDAETSTRRDGGCDIVHAFCDDFDDQNPGSTPDWGEAPTIDSSGSMKVRGFAEARSAPNVLESKVASASKAILSRTIAVTSPQHGVRCSFAYQIVAKNPSANAASIAVMTFRAGAAEYDVDFRYDTLIVTGKGADGGAAPSAVRPLQPADVGIWTPVTVSVTVGTQGVIDVDVGSGRVATFPTDPAISITKAPTAHLDLGLQPYSVGDTWQLLYDDVVCDLLP